MDTPSKNQDKSQNNVEDIANQKEDLEKPKDFSTEVSKLLEDQWDLNQNTKWMKSMVKVTEVEEYKIVDSSEPKEKMDQNQETPDQKEKDPQNEKPSEDKAPELLKDSLQISNQPVVIQVEKTKVTEEIVLSADKEEPGAVVITISVNAEGSQPTVSASASTKATFQEKKVEDQLSILKNRSASSELLAPPEDKSPQTPVKSTTILEYRSEKLAKKDEVQASNTRSQKVQVMMTIPEEPKIEINEASNESTPNSKSNGKSPRGRKSKKRPRTAGKRNKSEKREKAEKQPEEQQQE